MSDNNNRQLGEAPWLHVIISTGLGTGFVPKAPGTAGAFLALLIWVGLYLVLSPLQLCLATVLLVFGSFFIGVWTDNVMEKYWGEDPRAVVIDEFFGTWVAVAAVLFFNGSHLMVLFRLKPHGDAFGVYRFCALQDNRHYQAFGMSLDRQERARWPWLHAGRRVGWLLRFHPYSRHSVPCLLMTLS